MKLERIILIGLLGIMTFLYFTKKTPDKRRTVDIVVPERSGTFEKVKPVYVPINRPTYTRRTDTVIKYEINPDLVDAYQNANDSIERLNLYIEAIKEREFKNTFDDDRIEITVTGRTRGELLWLNADYTIKENSQPVNLPKPKINVFAGFSVQSGVNLHSTDVFMNVGLQNRNKDIFRVGYSPSGAFLFGFDKKLLSL